MTFDATKSLSASLEVYLQAIFWTVAAKGAARARDIARQLGVKASSVTSALQMLAEKEYVHYRPYEAVTLTPEGFNEAARVAQRHFVVREFFVRVLGLDDEAAEARACLLEHGLGDDVAERLAVLMEFMKSRPDVTGEVMQLLTERCHAGTVAMPLLKGPATVADLRPGQKGVIVSVRSGGAVSRRLVDMGLGRGALVEVEGVAPAGDPIRVKIRGYQLALRRNEAGAIAVVGR